MRSTWVLFVAMIVMTTAAVTSAQPAETCGPGALLGPVALPFSTFGSPASADFTLTGAGCLDATGDDDLVACFTPTSSCSVDIVCSSTGSVTLNLTTGACSTSPASCTGNASGTPAQLSGQAIVAATEYCVICSRTGAVGTISFDITTASGNCGLMPVSLTSFIVD